MTSPCGRLKAAFLAYDALLQQYALLGEAWTGDVPDLDRLYTEMRAAAAAVPDEAGELMTSEPTPEQRFLERNKRYSELEAELITLSRRIRETLYALRLDTVATTVDWPHTVTRLPAGTVFQLKPDEESTLPEPTALLLVRTISERTGTDWRWYRARSADLSREVLEDDA